MRINHLYFGLPLFRLFGFLLVAVPFILSGQSDAEKGFPFITTYSYLDYGADPLNWSIEEDDRGLMYFANSQGLLEYDGSNWKLIESGDNAGARALVKGRDGIIYAAMEGDLGYIGVLPSGETGFISLKENLPEEYKVFTTVWSVYTNERGIWFITSNYIFLWANDKFKIWESEDGYHNGDIVFGDLYMRIWNKGLHVMDGDSLVLVPDGEQFADERIYVYLPYDEEKILIGTRSQGLFLYDGNHFTPFITEADQKIKSAGLYLSGAVLHNGNFVLNFLAGGLLVINKQGKVVKDITVASGLPDNNVYEVFEDSKNNLWLAHANGISKIDMASSFSFFSAESGFQAKGVLDVIRYKDVIYTGVDHGIFYFDQSSQKFEKIPGTSGQSYRFVEIGGDLLIGDSDVGVVQIEGKRIIPVRLSVNYDYRAAILIPSMVDTTLIYVTTASSFSTLRLNPEVKGKGRWIEESSRDDIVALYLEETGDGKVWMDGDQPGQIRLLIPKYIEGKISLRESELKVYDSSHGLPDIGLFPFKFDDKIYFTNLKKSHFYSFNETSQQFVLEESPPFLDYVDTKVSTQFPVKDSEGNFWGEFGKGVFLAKGDENSGYSFVSTPFKEFQKLRVNNIYPEIDDKGNGVIWLATSEGLLRYDGELKEDYTEDYSTLIREIIVNNDSMFYLGGGDLPEDIKLKFSSNTIAFNYAAPYFKSEGNLEYQTFLEGYDSGWSVWRKQNEREYINLPPGNYTFRVKAKNVFDQLSTEDNFNFTITRPWYSTYWAYALYFLIGALMVYGFVRWRLKKLKDHSEELEKEVSVRTVEIQQRVEELGVINSVQEGLVEQLDLGAIYAMVGEKIKDVFDSQVTVINIFDHQNKLTHYKYVNEKGKIYDKVDPRPIDELRQRIIDTKKYILINKDYDKKMKEMGAVVATGGERPKSALWIPLVTGEKVIGSVSLQNIDHENAFSDNDVKLLGTLANSMAVALENARLFEESNKLLEEITFQSKELELINSVQEGLVEQMETDGIFTLVGDKISDRFEAQAVVINTFDEKADRAYYPYILEKGERLVVSEGVPLNNIFKELIADKKPILINTNYEQWRLKMGMGGALVGEIPKSALWVPLIMGDKVNGSVSLQNVDEENAFTEEDIELLTTLSNSMSVALENTRLFEETTQRANEMSIVNSVSQVLTSNLEIDVLMNVIGDKMQELFQADIVYIAMLNSDTNIISFPYQYGDTMAPLRVGEGLTSIIIQKNKPQLINKDVQRKSDEFGVERIGIAATSYLGVPIVSGNDVMGVLSVQSTKEVNRFAESDMHLLETIAGNVGIAIHNAQLYEEAGKSKAEAEQANEAKSAFLSTVSHELRTPLTSVLGFAKIIKKRLEERVFPTLDLGDKKLDRTVRQVSENLNVVVSEGQRLTKLINEVLDLAKIESGKTDWHMEELFVTNVIKRAISATDALFENKPIKLVQDFQDDLPAITGDEDKLIQVVVNLISNAVKFSDEGEITCSVVKANGEIEVSVKDCGIGIVEEDLDKVFEKFKQVGDTLTDKPKGTGLGLPISKEIVEHHGGRIWVESIPGEGSTFTFSLPMEKVKEGDFKTYKLDDLFKQIEEKFSSTLPINHFPGKKILVVDDEKHIRELLNQELSSFNYDVHVAADGKEGLDWVRNNKVDLVILDVMMPVMNGFDVAAVLKNDPRTKEIPIVILSIVEDKKRGYEIGIDRYLTKPIDMEKLLETISGLLGQENSKRKVMIVDEDASTVSTLMNVLEEKGYHTVEANGHELVEKAKIDKPDIIIVKSNLKSDKEKVKSMRLEKGMENILFLVYE